MKHEATYGKIIVLQFAKQNIKVALYIMKTISHCWDCLLPIRHACKPKNKDTTVSMLYDVQMHNTHNQIVNFSGIHNTKSLQDVECLIKLHTNNKIHTCWYLPYKYRSKTKILFNCFTWIDNDTITKLSDLTVLI